MIGNRGRNLSFTHGDEAAFIKAVYDLIAAAKVLREFKPSEAEAMLKGDWQWQPREVNSNKDPHELTDKEIRIQKNLVSDTRYNNHENAKGSKHFADAIASLDPKMLEALVTLLNQRADRNEEAEAKAANRFQALIDEEERRKEEAEKTKAVGDPQAAILALQRQIEELKAKGK